MNDFKKGLLVGIVIMSSIFLFIASTSPKMESKDRREIVIYKLITHNVLKQFNKGVNILIDDGWQPFDSPFIDKDDYYYQALVKYKED